MKARALAAAAAAIACTAGAGAVQVFRSGVAVVRVDVVVVDGDRAVAGLTKEDFALTDNGVAQTIDAVSLDEVPVSLMLALDASNSVDGPTLARLKEAAAAAVDALEPADRAALLTFAGDVRLRAGWQSPAAPMRDALGAIQALGATSLYDGAFAAMTLRDPEPGRRSLVLLFSDGVDTASWLPARAVLERARRTDAVVYAVSVRPPRPETRLEYRSGVTLWPAGTGLRGRGMPEPFITELAALTGGALFVTSRADRLAEAFRRITSEFRTRYVITYSPQGVEASGWHEISVTLTRRQGLVRARRGYIR